MAVVPKPRMPQPQPEPIQMNGQQFQYPPDHQVGMQVPQGGSSCASCKYLGGDGASCTSQYFIAWDGPGKPAGSGQLPAPADSYCSDLYEPKSLEGDETSSEAGQEDRLPDSQMAGDELRDGA